MKKQTPKIIISRRDFEDPRKKRMSKSELWGFVNFTFIGIMVLIGACFFFIHYGIDFGVLVCFFGIGMYFILWLLFLGLWLKEETK